MPKKCDLFGISFSNIPILNLRKEFYTHLALFESAEFRAPFQRGNLGPVRVPKFLWLGMPGDCLTLLLQRAVLGLEAYVPVAVWSELGCRGRLKDGITKFIHNPFRLKGSNAADKYFNSLPALYDEKCQLRLYNESLWNETQIFYEEIRNPIFHGYEIESDDFEGVHKAFHHIKKLYSWVDSWHDLNAFLPFKSKPKQALDG